MSAPIPIIEFQTAPMPKVETREEREFRENARCKKVTQIAGIVTMSIGAIGFFAVPLIAKSVLENEYMVVAFPGCLVSFAVACLGVKIFDSTYTSTQNSERDIYVV